MQTEINMEAKYRRVNTLDGERVGTFVIQFIGRGTPVFMDVHSGDLIPFSSVVFAERGN